MGCSVHTADGLADQGWQKSSAKHDPCTHPYAAQRWDISQPRRGPTDPGPALYSGQKTDVASSCQGKQWVSRWLGLQDNLLIHLLAVRASLSKWGKGEDQRA